MVLDCKKERKQVFLVDILCEYVLGVVTHPILKKNYLLHTYSYCILLIMKIIHM